MRNRFWASYRQNENSRRDLVRQSAASRAAPSDLEAIRNIRGTSARSRGFYLLMHSRSGSAEQVGLGLRTTVLPHFTRRTASISGSTAALGGCVQAVGPVSV